MKGMIRAQENLYEENRNQGPPSVSVQSDRRLEARIKELENQIGSTKDILTKEVVEFSKFTIQHKIRIDGCNLKVVQQEHQI